MVAEKDGETIGGGAHPAGHQPGAGEDEGAPAAARLVALPAQPQDRPGPGRFALGVKPEYQHTGVAASLYVEHFDTAARARQDHGEAGWILETNEAMNRGMEGMSGEIVKKYRVYERSLQRAEPPGALESPRWTELQLDGEVIAEEDAGSGEATDPVRPLPSTLEDRPDLSGPAAGGAHRRARRGGRSARRGGHGRRGAGRQRAAAKARPQRRSPGRGRARENVVASRSFLVDVHLLGR